MAIRILSGLSFLGLGVETPTPEWGAMISVARNYLPDWWWYSFFPGLAIFITVLAISLVGDGLNDALNPKLRQR